jgi:hypothetical protein
MTETLPRLIEGVEIVGAINTCDETLRTHIASAIRRGHPQVRPEPIKPDRVALVGSGPSLTDTVDELREMVFEGAKVVALNGALEWCVSQNIRPSAVVVVDARETNARFVARDVPQCIYYIASQCHPSVWDAVEGHERVVIWHAMNPTSTEGEMLDSYYGKGRWYGVTGGTTVGTRALALLRMSGYLRFDCFGIDSCWLHGEHHAFAQAENSTDRRIEVTIAPKDSAVPGRAFQCAPWHIQQLEDFLAMIRIHGDEFLLRFHGDGLLAHALSAGASVSITESASVKERV